MLTPNKSTKSKRLGYRTVLSILVSLAIVLCVVENPVTTAVQGWFSECHDGQRENGVLVADYFGDTFTLYERSGNQKLCPPLPVSVPPNASILQCRWYQHPPVPCTYRLRAKLHCNETSADILYEWVDLDSAPSVYQFDDQCLAKVIADRCTRDDQIPRLVHYVRFGHKQFIFHALISVMSALKFVQPCLVLFHADYLPYGKHWEALLQLVPHVIHVKQSAPDSIFGHKIEVVHHKADVARLQVMRKFGGVYSDLDHVTLRPVDDLLHYNVVMGAEDGRSLGNGFYLAKPGAKFLDLWYNSYVTFDDSSWAQHSTRMPRKLYNEDRTHSLGVHVVDSFFKPDWCRSTEDFYEKRYNWTNSYGVHLFHNRNKKFFRTRLDRQESSLGEVTRHVLFGGSDRCVGEETPSAPVRLNVTEGVNMGDTETRRTRR